MGKGYGNRRLGEFLVEACKARKLSLRRLSLNSGLSPGTVYSIINRKYQPNVYSLNQLADCLGVERPYLWQLAGLIEDTGILPGDIRLKSQIARAQELPEDARNLLYNVIEQILKHYKKTDHSST
jgi:transcriptional regulator with XRE-family HTH domain